MWCYPQAYWDAEVDFFFNYSFWLISEGMEECEDLVVKVNKKKKENKAPKKAKPQDTEQWFSCIYFPFAKYNNYFLIPISCLN